MMRKAGSFDIERFSSQPTLPRSLKSFSREFSRHSDILRSVTLPRALGGFGRHWHGETTGGLRTVTQDLSEDLYKLSAPAEVIDDFISHNWATSGRLKFLSLCWYYNGPAAIIVSLVAAGAVGLLQANSDLRTCLIVRRAWGDGTMAVGLWSQVVGIAFFAGTLVTWHHVRSCFFCTRPLTIFMDKLCISQSDPELKHEGILALAGFLGVSQRLVVLWSPTYFSRLWCVYEIASWLHLEKGSIANMKLLPISQTVIVLYFFVCTAIVSMINSVGRALPACWYVALSMASTFGCCLPKAVLIFRLIEQHYTLRDQLCKFSVRDAKCYCCTVGHVAPDTGETLACDRELIEEMLQRWFPPEPGLGAIPGHHLEAFDSQVRGEVAHEILSKTGCGGGISYRVAILFTLPVWYGVLDCLPAWPTLNWVERSRYLLLAARYCLLAMPLTLALYSSACIYFTSRARGGPLGRLEMTGLVLTYTVSFMTIYSAGLVTFTWENPWPQVLEAAVLTMLMCIAFRVRAALCCAEVCKACV